MSDYENYSIGGSQSLATTIPYDGFLYFTEYGGNTVTVLNINGFAQSQGNIGGNTVVIPICKGDVVYGNPRTLKARFYKLRDYSNR